MRADQSVQDASRSCVMEIAIAFLTVCVILVITAGYRNFDDNFACGGGLGVGFPVSFLCDYGAGGSPIDNWGKIDLSDFPYFSGQGLLIDILFYSGILWMSWLIRRVMRHADANHPGNTLWLTFVGIAFIAGFLSAAGIYKADRINFHNYILGIPTSVPATPTPFGTPPPPESSPIPTPGP